jgi:hypothetical protein
VSAAILDRANPGTLYVAFAASGIFRTTDSGATWASISDRLGSIAQNVYSLALDPVVPNRLFATLGGGELYRTDDGGTSWVRVSSAAVDEILLAVPGALYGQRGVNLVVSNDGGQTWSPIGTGLPPSNGAAFRAFIQDPANPGVLFVGTPGSGVFRSTDAGRTWSAFNDGIANRFVDALLIPPSGDPLLYAGTDAGLFDYRDSSDFRLTLPAVASLHGFPPTFFHSDVWILNGSAQNEATVTATYRCAAGSCGDAVQTFTIPPRQVRFFPDIVGTLFHAPETFGAIEIDSAQLIVVTSRLYTPSREEPTVGMYVPSRQPNEAYPVSVLTSLTHDPLFRTNVGVYNPNDFAQPVLFQFFGASGGFLGEIFESVGARRSIQVNDPEIFSRVSLPAGTSDFYCLVVGDGFHSLFAYASVIDNSSQDPIFVPGADARSGLVANTTLPAVAHLPGANGTFFKSDVRVWNASAEDFAQVTVRFACFEGNCGERAFTVAPRQMLAWDDIVTSLFHSTSSGGAMEFVSTAPIVVTSRLYTPTLIESTYGMFVPGVPPERSAPASVLNGLSHPPDASTGSRVNVGVFNQADVAQVVTYRLFDGSGNPLGQTTRFFAPREFFQMNDVFASLNVSQSLESAYCLVEGSALLPLFTYAAIIDNRSQDPIFVLGEDDPEHPPILPLGRPQ